MDFGPAPESAKPAEEWLEKNGRRFNHFINGKFCRGKTGRRFETVNPATGTALAAVCQGSKGDIEVAVKAARAAQRKWEGLFAGRSRYLYALSRLIQKYSRLFAIIETLDNGKPIRESRDIDVPLAARHFLYHAGAASLTLSELERRVPYGVCGAIIPWNFPLLMLAWKIAPAIATGNTVVLKPAEYTPLSAMLFSELCREAELPPGVVNIVTGDGRTGELLVRHPGVDKIAFTGSTTVGRRIRKLTAGKRVGLTLELGGKSPYIVFEDADIDSAVEGLVDAIWLNQGEVCCAGSRLLVQEGIADRFHSKLKARMDRLRVGDPLDKCIDIGAVVDPAQLKRITDLVSDGTCEGGDVHVAKVSLPGTGCYYPPTLITGLSPSSVLMQEEIFGPVLAGTTFRTPDEAVALANNSRYGLAGTLWTENISLAMDIAKRLVCGVVWVNTTNMFDAAVGFGGRRESGFGREGGWEGLYNYTRPEDPPQYMKRPLGNIDDDREPARTVSPLDRTAKMYIGGRQVRPDGGNSSPVCKFNGKVMGHFGLGNRKDIRNAVEAARKSFPAWASRSGYNRSQIIYYIAENLAARDMELADRIGDLTGRDYDSTIDEVKSSVDRLIYYAAWADKFDGAVHDAPMNGFVLAVKEPIGVIGILCPLLFPLLGLVSVMAPAIAMGNCCVLVPSERYPLVATDFCQVLDTSDLPPGVVNIVTGLYESVAPPLAGHDDVDAFWAFAATNCAKTFEAESAGNLKRTWIDEFEPRDWRNQLTDYTEFLRQSTDTKNIWIPCGE